MKENVEKVISFQTPAFALVFVKIVNTNMTTAVVGEDLFVSCKTT